MWNILLAEENEMLALSMQEMLHKLGHTCVIVNNVSKVIEMLARSRFDIVILHQGKGEGEKGLDVAAKIRKANHSLPIILFSGLPLEEEALEADIFYLAKILINRQTLDAALGAAVHSRASMPSGKL